MIDELKELNEKFFQLYARLDRYIEKLSDEQVKIMQEKLLEQYELEYQLLSLSCDIETKREIERLTALQELLIPAKWKTRIFRRKRQNYAQTLVDESVALEAQEFYEKCERELAERYPSQEPTPGTLQEKPQESEGTTAEPPAQNAMGRADEKAQPEPEGQKDAEKQPVTGDADGTEKNSEKGNTDREGEKHASETEEKETGIDAVEIL